MASSSSTTTQHEYPTCYCGIPAKANPGRRFSGCANWERKEQKCKYFFWVDLPSRDKELDAKNGALEMKLEYMEKMNQDLCKENKKSKKKLVALKAKVLSYKLWCSILIVACISIYFARKNVVVGSVKYLP